VRTVSLLPQSYFIGFVHSGINIQGGHEMLIDKCWLGETWCGAETIMPPPPLSTIRTHIKNHLPRRARDKSEENSKATIVSILQVGRAAAAQSILNRDPRAYWFSFWNFHMFVPSLSWQTMLPFNESFLMKSNTH
jgi:hypothetical protein